MTSKVSTTGHAPAPKNGQKFFGADLDLMFTLRRHNFETMMRLSRLTLDGAQEAWRHQLNVFEQAIGRFTMLVSSFGLANGHSSDHFSGQAELGRETFETSLAGARELTDLMAKSAYDAISIFGQRYYDGFDEIRRAGQKRNSAQ